MLTPTVEDYLRQIHASQQPERGVFVGMKHLADAMGVTPGTATAMARSLARSGLVRYVIRKGVRLTPEGEREALRVHRRHRLIELFLVKVLGMDWADVHEDAHRLEHALSPRVEEAMDRVLGRPSVDPHGDPIPGGRNPGGGDPGGVTRSLAEAPPEASMRVARVQDQSSDFLHFAARVGLVPGAVVSLLVSDPVAGTATIRIADHEVAVGLPLLDRIRVRPV